MQALTPTIKEAAMAEAHNSVHLTQLRTRLHIAIAVIARRAAIRETKAEMQRRGVKPAYVPYREIVAAANEYAAQHRAELIAEAKQIVAKWEAEGFFGRAKLKTFDQRATR
jgi:hypothetical protein